MLGGSDLSDLERMIERMIDKYLSSAKVQYNAVSGMAGEAKRHVKEMIMRQHPKRMGTIEWVMHSIYSYVRHSRYAIMTVLGLFFGMFLTITSPIWLTLLLLNLPVFLFLYALVSYTHVKNFFQFNHF